MTPRGKMVLDYIDLWGSITQHEASKDLGIDRLASRVSSLEQEAQDG